jgi:hypothetical protein
MIKIRKEIEKMFIIQQKLFDYAVNLNSFTCDDESGLSQLQIDCQELNDKEKGFIEYSIIELEDQFLCAVCNTIYYDKYRNKNDCDCGAIRCEFCEDLNTCACDEDDDLELQELDFEDEKE